MFENATSPPGDSFSSLPTLLSYAATCFKHVFRKYSDLTICWSHCISRNQVLQTPLTICFVFLANIVLYFSLCDGCHEHKLHFDKVCVNDIHHKKKKDNTIFVKKTIEIGAEFKRTAIVPCSILFDLNCINNATLHCTCPI